MVFPSCDISMTSVSSCYVHNLTYVYCRFEPDMLAFSGCDFGGGEKERAELAEIRKRWDTLPVSSPISSA